MRGIQGKLRWGKLCLLATACMMACTAKAQEQVTSKFNAANVILPSSQYTPGQPYEAWVWVYNKGERYSDSMYNIIQGVPDKDAQGRQWYEPDYALTDNGMAWKKARSPFSSDEYYKEQKSCQWVTADIMGEMYMRRSFVLNGAIEGTVYLSTGHDDAPSEWYINGTQVHAVTDGWNNDIADGDGFEDDRDAYAEENIFFVPEEARWSKIASAAHTPEIGTVIDDAMRAIERENATLKNVLPKNYASPDLEKRVLGDVVCPSPFQCREQRPRYFA